MRRRARLLADLELRRDQSEAAKTVGDLLLSAGEFVAHGEHHQRRSVHAALYGVERHACPTGEQAGKFRAMRARPFRDAAELGDDLCDDRLVGLDVGATAHEVRILLGDVGPLCQRAHARPRFEQRVVWIPDGPGIDRTTLECRAGVGGAEIDRLDVVVGGACLFERGECEVVRAGSAAERDLPALEVMQRLQ
jgi:hypothetical protein